MRRGEAGAMKPAAQHSADSSRVARSILLPSESADGLQNFLLSELSSARSREKTADKKTKRWLPALRCLNFGPLEVLPPQVCECRPLEVPPSSPWLNSPGYGF